MTYRVMNDGEGVEFRSGERWKFACCDCGLVHDMVIVSRGRKIGLALKRNKRATAAKRRKAQRMVKRPVANP